MQETPDEIFDIGTPDPERDEWLLSLRPIDDAMMQNIFIKDELHDNDIAQSMLRIILNNPELKLISVKGQCEFKNLHGRSLVMDLLAIDADDNFYDMEFQLDARGFSPERAGFHCDMLASAMLKEGQRFEELKNGTVIFITRDDVRGEGKPLYDIRSGDCGSGRLFDDKRRYVLVNGKMGGDQTELAKLVHDLFCADPDEMYHDFLRTAVRQIKFTTEGQQMVMSGYVAKTYARGEAQGEARGEIRGEIRGEKKGMIKAALGMFKEKLPFETILKVTGLDKETLQLLKLSLQEETSTPADPGQS